PESAEQPSTESADPLKAMTGRAGEATLSPVNNTASFDVPAPAGKGAWDTYSLQDEWVGEPMPIGTPVKTASPAPQAGHQSGLQSEPISAQGMPQVSARDALSAAPVSPSVAASGKEEKSYVSPSLAHPGEWVGEPMPMTKPARQDDAPGAVSQESKRDSGHAADERRSRQVEMPRTATGRLILKLLGSAGDRPLGADNEPLPGGKPDLMADLAAMPREDDTPILASTAPTGPDAVSPEAASPARPAEPQRAAAHLKGKTASSSIMNFIAGAAEALRNSGHEDAIPARQDVRPAAPVAAERALWRSRQPTSCRRQSLRPLCRHRRRFSPLPRVKRIKPFRSLWRGLMPPWTMPSRASKTAAARWWVMRPTALPRNLTPLASACWPVWPVVWSAPPRPMT
ncbi:MAG: hypothetical protein QM665_06575, partial [Desulfovibrio sp.]